MMGSALAHRGISRRAVALILVLAVTVSLSGVVAFAEVVPEGLEITSIERLSLDSTGAEVGYDSELAWISDDGRYVLFWTNAALVPEDTNSMTDCYRKDTVTGEIILVSVANGGSVGMGSSFPWGISADGNRAVFTSSATTLVAGDTNFMQDVFVRDIDLGVTWIASLTDGEGNADRGADDGCISADGRYVVFTSSSENLIAGDTPLTTDVFVRDLILGTTVCASVTTTGVPGTGTADYASISGDGRYVAFMYSSDLVGDDAGRGVFVRDMQTGTTERITQTTDGLATNAPCFFATISADGRFVTFHTQASNIVEGDLGGEKDVFLHDRQTGTTELISVRTDGEQGNGESRWASLSDDGRYVAFYSYATNLVDDDTNNEPDVFIRDRASGRTVRASVAGDGSEGDGTSESPNISGDGTRVAFESRSTNFVADDTNNAMDVFAADVDWVLDEVEIQGLTRFSTGVAISQAAFPESSTVDTVLISTGRNWPDALGGSALAGVLDAPILLVDTHSIPTEVADEIRRLDPERAVILGGAAAVGSEIYEALTTDLGIGTVDRIEGANRYETGHVIAAEVARELGSDFDGTVFVTTGRNFPDALAASPIATAEGWPIYTVGATLDQAILDAMHDIEVTEVIILGGTSAVSSEIEEALEDEYGVFGVTRLDGASRYSTARTVAEFGVNECGLRWDGVALATGASFPDALAGGVLQAKAQSVLLLTPPTVLDSATAGALTENADIIHEIRFLGGLSAISQDVRDSATAIVE